MARVQSSEQPNYFFNCKTYANTALLVRLPYYKGKIMKSVSAFFESFGYFLASFKPLKKPDPCKVVDYDVLRDLSASCVLKIPWLPAPKISRKFIHSIMAVNLVRSSICAGFHDRRVCHQLMEFGYAFPEAAEFAQAIYFLTYLVCFIEVLAANERRKSANWLKLYSEKFRSHITRNESWKMLRESINMAYKLNWLFYRFSCILLIPLIFSRISLNAHWAWWTPLNLSMFLASAISIDFCGRQCFNDSFFFQSYALIVGFRLNLVRKLLESLLYREAYEESIRSSLRAYSESSLDTKKAKNVLSVFSGCKFMCAFGWSTLSIYGLLFTTASFFSKLILSFTCVAAFLATNTLDAVLAGKTYKSVRIDR